MYDSKIALNQTSQENTLESMKTISKNNRVILKHSFIDDQQNNQNKLKKETNIINKEKSNTNIKILPLSTILGEEIEQKAQKNKHEFKKTLSDNRYFYVLKKYSKLGEKSPFKSNNKKSYSNNDLTQDTKEILKTNSIFDVNKYAESHNDSKKAPLKQSYSRILSDHPRQLLRTPQPPPPQNNNAYNNIYNISITDKLSSSDNETNDNKMNNDPENEKKILLKKFDDHLDMNDTINSDRKLLKTPSITTTKKPKK
ncbi:hypothetical protein PIROE2DRAFT_2118 [Piromyces sp. E2]|nr:hypothetical protein PIROE2DRAFT_2118 [Piromyces sp. E2]|eukprot:OUM69919.1 hypothetical protein PIROE2DRAFT_2118 [Piromyces sp. E2]